VTMTSSVLMSVDLDIRSNQKHEFKNIIASLAACGEFLLLTNGPPAYSFDIYVTEFTILSSFSCKSRLP